MAFLGYWLSSEAVFPAAVLDCRAAVRFLRKNAERFMLDPGRFAAVGSPAGGNLAAVLEQNYGRYKTLPGFETCDVADYIRQGQREDLKRQTYLMNATHIPLDCARGGQKADISRSWRTRNGAADEHTSFSIAYNLCTAARMAGAEADYALIWNAPHGDVDGDGTGSFTEWVHQIV